MWTASYAAVNILFVRVWVCSDTWGQLFLHSEALGAETELERWSHDGAESSFSASQSLLFPVSKNEPTSL